MTHKPGILPLGDSAISIRFATDISEETSALVVARSSLIRTAAIRGVSDVVPSYATVGVHYDPLVIGFGDLCERIASLLDAPLPADSGMGDSVLHRIPVQYTGDDLDDIALRTGLARDELIRIHSEREYRVYVVGFVPGFAYLGQLDERLALPRRESPRQRVPAGSVAIAERQTGIYPSPTPGGWHLIGTTRVTLFDPASEPPSRFKVGDRVRFEP